MKKYNDCSKCPYFKQSYDYWGECNEWCEIYYNKINCYHPMIIRKFLYLICKIKKLYYDYNFIKEEEFRYKERKKLGMTEEEYDKFN